MVKTIINWFENWSDMYILIFTEKLPYFWKCSAGFSKFLHTVVFTVLWAQVSTCSASLTFTNEDVSWASNGETSCILWYHIHQDNRFQNLFKTCVYVFIVNKHREHVQYFTCIVFVMEVRISKIVASRSCKVGYISIFSSSNVKDIRNMGKCWQLLESNRIANSSTLFWSRNFNLGDKTMSRIIINIQWEYFKISTTFISINSPDLRWGWMHF